MSRGNCIRLLNPRDMNGHSLSCENRKRCINWASSARKCSLISRQQRGIFPLSAIKYIHRSRKYDRQQCETRPINYAKCRAVETKRNKTNTEIPQNREHLWKAPDAVLKGHVFGSCGRVCLMTCVALLPRIWSTMQCVNVAPVHSAFHLHITRNRRPCVPSTVKLLNLSFPMHMASRIYFMEMFNIKKLRK